MKLEICANSVQSAVNAQEGGAQRIELCCNLEEGGLTPSAATIQLARKWLAIEVFVLIRPRIGNFCYSDIEFETMLKEILFCKDEGVDGVVFGVLNKDGTIDLERNAILVEAARPMQVTFHRAFDCIPDASKGLEQLIQVKFDRVLTSGQQVTAMEGKALIQQFVQQAKDRITILPGSGLSANNLKDFIAYTGVKEVHLSAKMLVDRQETGLFAATSFETDVAQVRKVSKSLTSLL